MSETDVEFLERIAAINDPYLLLQELVQLEINVAGVGDPYYRDLYWAIINRAEQLIVAQGITLEE